MVENIKEKCLNVSKANDEISKELRVAFLGGQKWEMNNLKERRIGTYKGI